MKIAVGEDSFRKLGALFKSDVNALLIKIYFGFASSEKTQFVPFNRDNLIYAIICIYGNVINTGQDALIYPLFSCVLCVNYFSLFFFFLFFYNRTSIHGRSIKAAPGLFITREKGDKYSVCKRFLCVISLVPLGSGLAQGAPHVLRFWSAGRRL